MGTLRTFSIADLTDAKYIALKGSTLDTYGNPFFTIDNIVWAMNVIVWFKQLHSSAKLLANAFGLQHGYGLKMAYDYLKQGHSMEELTSYAQETYNTRDCIVWSSTSDKVTKAAIAARVARPIRYVRDDAYSMDAFSKGSSTMKIRYGKDTASKRNRSNAVYSHHTSKLTAKENRGLQAKIA